MNVHSTSHASTAHAAPPTHKAPKSVEKPREHGSDDIPKVKAAPAKGSGSVVDRTV